MSAVSGVKLTRLLQDVSDEDEEPMTIPVNTDLKLPSKKGKANVSLDDSNSQ